MLIKSQKGNLIYMFGNECYIEVLNTRSGTCLLAHSTTSSPGHVVELGRYQNLEHAYVILNDIFDSYGKGEQCFDVAFVDAMHWGRGTKHD